MVGQGSVGQSGKGDEDASGVLFHIGARIALVVFTGVLALGMGRGMEPTLALIRALVALAGIIALGWLAELIAGSARVPPVEPEPAPEPEHDEREFEVDD
jgi:hypothetical protein